MSASDDLVTLVCPPGAELAPISHGDGAFTPWREHGDHGIWLVRVPREVARHFCWNGGFRVFEPPDPA
jgi:hypothetical protein